MQRFDVIAHCWAQFLVVVVAMQEGLTMVRLLILMVTLGGLLTGTGKAMEFRLEDENGGNVILANGEIVPGDPGRLTAAVAGTGRDKFGNIRMYLNSPGGSVAAAFGMVEVMDREEFTALVTGDGRCASACASIVYISARMHLVTDKALLGLHTCYSSSNREPLDFCNRIIAENAVKHGTSYGALNMWQSSYSPESMAWLGADVACKYGLCGPPGVDETEAKPSFDCRGAQKPSETAICANKRLARHEASLAKLYTKFMLGLGGGDKERLRAEQRAWLKYRDSCDGVQIENCLLERIDARYQELLNQEISRSLDRP
jgi:uncharacterized protein YecT (DUF1311 family)